MKKKNIIILVTFAFFSLLLVSLVIADSMKEDFYLVPFDDDSHGIGKAYVRTWTLEGLNYMELNFWVKELPVIPGRVYEVWLIDEDSAPDYKLSLGTFQADSVGKEHFEITQTMANPGIYEKLVITREPRNDINPEPSSEEVLIGDIPGGLRDKITLHTLIKGRDEEPNSRSRATGYGEFILDSGKNEIEYVITYRNLEGFETDAHIHGFAPMGVNAEVLEDIGLGRTKTGTWEYSQSEEKDIIAGLTYVNVHSHLWPDGEIRGQIQIV